ncbi:MAG: hypothetical protein FJX76_14130 [Armatimonadetes bacterium]|nr:hypothetical protein [Armatimonadota bacterium]
MCPRFHRALRGFTLLEVCITIGLLMLFLIMLGDCMAAAYRATNKSTQSVSNYRLAVTALDALGRELRACTTVYSPNPATLNPGVVITPNRAKPLIFRYNDAGVSTVAMWWFEEEPQKLYRVRYQMTYEYGKPSTYKLQGGDPAAGRVMLRMVTAVVLEKLDPTSTNDVNMLRVRATMAGMDSLLTVEASVLGL